MTKREDPIRHSSFGFDSGFCYGHSGFILRLLLLGVFTFGMVRSAWVAEDAYIAYRTADNFVHGYGLRWNRDERVQTFTCPLYLLLFSGVHAVTREVYYTGIFLGMALSLAAAGMVAFRASGRTAAAILALAILAASKGFVDFSTSGLESPLTHLLIAAFAAVFLVDLANTLSARRFLILCVIASLAAVNRMDGILLFLPALAYGWWIQRDRRRAVLMAVVGLGPLILWLLFSLIYYGFPFPNTAYGKLKNGIPTGALWQQGFWYLQNSLRNDPVTLAAIAGAVTMAIGSRRPRLMAAAAGIVVFLFYVVRIGGDYMSGRFLTAPLMLAACVIAACPELPRWTVAGAVAAVGAIALGLPNSPLRAGPYYGRVAIENLIDEHLISDERAVYYQSLGLLHAGDGKFGNGYTLLSDGLRDRQTLPPCSVAAAGTAGLWCYYGGPTIHYIEPAGLSDALIARLPPIYDANWRIGHFVRAIPDGYIETLATGRNVIADPDLARYYEKLSLLTRGPLFSPRRLIEIVKFNLGMYDPLIHRRYYRRPRIRDGEDPARPRIPLKIPVAFPPPAR